MRVDNVEVGTSTHLLHFVQHDLAVLQPHAGIDDQRRPAADDDADVGHHAHFEVRNHVDMLRDLDRGTGLLQGHGPLGRGLGRRDSAQAGPTTHVTTRIHTPA